METQEFVIFQTFNDPALALDLANTLKENNIEYEFDESGNFDPTFSNSDLNKEYKIKMRSSDFEKANTLLQVLNAKQVEEVEKDYYLFGFTDNELMEVVSKSDEWSRFDYLLAMKILKERGREVNNIKAQELQKERYNKLAKPDKASIQMIFFGYFLAIIGGPVGMLIGYNIMSSKRTLPDGKRIYSFDQESRRHGNRIFAIGIIAIVIVIISRIIYYSKQS